jgi:hypothetical protein
LTLEEGVAAGVGFLVVLVDEADEVLGFCAEGTCDFHAEGEEASTMVACGFLVVALLLGISVLNGRKRANTRGTEQRRGSGVTDVDVDEEGAVVEGGVEVDAVGTGVADLELWSDGCAGLTHGCGKDFTDSVVAVGDHRAGEAGAV